MSRERSKLKTLLLKLGVALTLSFSGYLYSRHRTRRVRASRAPPSIVTRSSGAAPEDNKHASHGASTSSNVDSCMREKYQEEMCTEKATVDDNTPTTLSSRGKNVRENDGLPLPELNESVKEVDYSGADTAISPQKGVELRKTYRCVDEYEQEIKHLKSMVRMLREKERNLEVQLLEYYGLKEQETTVMELENRLRISNMEAKLLSLKIESLQAYNRRLETKVTDHTKLAGKLEAAKGKIKLLKKKLKYEAEQNREHILTLQDRVTNLKEQEQKSSANDVDVQSKLQKLKDLEGEAEDLRSSNLSLEQENAELGQKLESTQMIDSKQEELKEANDQLKEEIEALTKKIEGLQVEKCADAEELVYLRWLNACLRFELKNRQSSPGNIAVGRDLGSKASPKSDEKPKKLVIEYPNSDGAGEKASNIPDFEPDRWSTSQASEFEMPDGSPTDPSTPQKSRSSKKKFIDKLKKLIRGKDSSSGQTQQASSERDDTESSYSWSAGFEATPSNKFTTPARRSSTVLPLDIPRSRTNKAEEDGKYPEIRPIKTRPGRDKIYDPNRRASEDFAPEMDSYFTTDKSYLAKYSAPHKINSAGGRAGTPRFFRKSASYSSF